MSCREGHPPRHPDFAEGNAHALVHGARSPRVIDPLAAEVVAEAVEDAPYLAEPKFRASVMAWAREEARCLVLADYLDVNGLHDEEGHLRPAEQAMHRAETRAANLRSRLGLDPLSRARLGKDVAQTVSLTQLWQQMDDQDAQEAAQASISGPDAAGVTQ